MPRDLEVNVGDETNLRERLSRLHTALLADVMDQLGFRDSPLGPDIRPMVPEQTVAGKAFTMRCVALESLQRAHTSISWPHTRTSERATSSSCSVPTGYPPCGASCSAPRRR